MTLDSLEQEVESLKTRLLQVEATLSDHGQRFDTLQTPLWKRVMFRLDGWPGQTNLNADRPAWRPWRRRAS